MTCGIAVKRPLDYESYLSSPETGVGIKRSRHEASLKCSPFQPQLGTLATSLAQSANSTSFQQKSEMHTSSPFASLAGKCQLSSSQLESYLVAEVQYLKRRKLIPRRGNGTFISAGGEAEQGMVAMHSAQDPNKTPVSAYRRAASSPSPSNSGSDSDGETSGRNGMMVEQAPISQDAGMTTANLYEKPQFSLRQVKLICERLLKEQEIRLRYEYETVLIKKLDEQHDQYVQFAKEQLEARASTSNDMSYLS
jgi:hypothetical protein